ncbi:MAG: imidazole glycerol phosphate synthase subunit HisH [Candidatus Omnitrophica bacterium]|nr:imidazole glycerol phosphate synthase subunit HisH [Candidatus Omnitrophota bacterium]
MTGIVNYGAGNIHSVFTAVKTCGEEPFVIEKAADLKKAAIVILPGVGAFADGMKSLTESGIIEPLITGIKEGKPFLGICLGLQLLFSHSEEGSCGGFGLIKGGVKKFSFADRAFRIPHMGWNRVKISSPGETLFKNIPDCEYFYFAHSYYPAPENRRVIIGETFYGNEFVSAVRRENIAGVQFHPEKSGDSGILFLKNFLEGKWLR